MNFLLNEAETLGPTPLVSVFVYQIMYANYITSESLFATVCQHVSIFTLPYNLSSHLPLIKYEICVQYIQMYVPKTTTAKEKQQKINEILRVIHLNQKFEENVCKRQFDAAQ